MLERRALGGNLLAGLERLVFLRPAPAMIVGHALHRPGVGIAGHDDLDPLLVAEDRPPGVDRGARILDAVEEEARIVALGLRAERVGAGELTVADGHERLLEMCRR